MVSNPRKKEGTVCGRDDLRRLRLSVISENRNESGGGDIWDLLAYRVAMLDRRMVGSLMQSSVKRPQNNVYHRSDDAGAVDRTWRLARSTDRRPRC